MSSSLVSSSQLSSISFGLFLFFFPGSRPSNTVLAKEPCRMPQPSLLSMSSLLNSTVLALHHSFCAPSKIPTTCDVKSISNASILFVSLFCSVYASLPYNAILHTNALTTRFYGVFMCM